MFPYGYVMIMSNDFSFTPVPRSTPRHDGWSPEKQSAFIDALAEYGMVRAAVEKVGMNVTSAYRLRAADGAESFAAAWDKALQIGQASLADIAMDRAVHGVPVPVFYKGEQVGERRWVDNRLLMFMLRQTQTRRYGTHAAHFDFVDEVIATEKAQKAKQQKLYDDTIAAADALDEMTSAYDDGNNVAAFTEEEVRDMARKSERLRELAENVKPFDLEAEQRTAAETYADRDKARDETLATLRSRYDLINEYKTEPG